MVTWNDKNSQRLVHQTCLSMGFFTSKIKQFVMAYISLHSTERSFKNSKYLVLKYTDLPLCQVIVATSRSRRTNLLISSGVSSFGFVFVMPSFWDQKRKQYGSLQKDYIEVQKESTREKKTWVNDHFMVYVTDTVQQ